VFGIEIERCDECGGTVKIIASIEKPEVIAAILEHLALDRSADSQPRLPAARGPPPLTGPRLVLVSRHLSPSPP
jgi:hypothetical protein